MDIPLFPGLHIEIEVLTGDASKRFTHFVIFHLNDPFLRATAARIIDGRAITAEPGLGSSGIAASNDFVRRHQRVDQGQNRRR